MAVFEVPLIANGLAAETGAGKAIRSATTNVTPVYCDCKYMDVTWRKSAEFRNPEVEEARVGRSLLYKANEFL